jgi:phosphatidylinositol glycan class S
VSVIRQVKNRDLRVAMNQSAIALDAATRAAFNHEMLAMLYFPDEHKWAVYTPLFGPIGTSVA